MKEDYDTMGPEATIQTTGNNGTGKALHDTSMACLLYQVELAVREATKQLLARLQFSKRETLTSFSWFFIFSPSSITPVQRRTHSARVPAASPVPRDISAPDFFSMPPWEITVFSSVRRCFPSEGEPCLV